LIVGARAITVAVATALTVGGIAVAAPASAATASTCTTYGTVALKSDPSEFAQIPRDSNGSYTCYLSEGDTGPGVAKLQNHLNRCYNAGLTVDGDFGYYTYAALFAAQRHFDEPGADGEYGPRTRDGINWFASNLTCNQISSYVGF